MKLTVASHISAAVTTTTKPAWIELESSSPWVVIVVGKVVGKVVVGKVVGKVVLSLRLLGPLVQHQGGGDVGNGDVVARKMGLGTHLDCL